MMDIQRWLDEIVDAENPLVPAQTSGPNFLHRPDKPKSVFRKQRVPKRTKSDSSVLAPQPHSPNAPSEKRKRKRSINRIPDMDSCSEVSRPSHNASTESKPSSACYARKPRRKTRLGRYEPKQHKEPAKYAHHSRKSESKRSKCTSTRKKGEMMDSGVAQTFQAKNVSRDRLTVRAVGHAVLCSVTNDWCGS
jgi:hypothetical protein